MEKRKGIGGGGKPIGRGGVTILYTYTRMPQWRLILCILCTQDKRYIAIAIEMGETQHLLKMIPRKRGRERNYLASSPHACPLHISYWWRSGTKPQTEEPGKNSLQRACPPKSEQGWRGTHEHTSLSSLFSIPSHPFLLVFHCHKTTSCFYPLQKILHRSFLQRYFYPPPKKEHKTSCVTLCTLSQGQGFSSAA